MSSSEGGPRRPARVRKTVTHYSDDNPSTFTVKRKRNDPPEDMRQRRRESRASYNPQNPSFRRTSSSNLSAASSVSSSLNARTNGINARPAKSSTRRSSHSNAPHVNEHHHSHNHSSSSLHSTKRKRPRDETTTASSSLSTLAVTTSPPSDEILAHRVTIQPVLRPANAPALQTRKHLTAQSGLAKLAAHSKWSLPTPKVNGWKRLPAAFSQHTLKGPSGESIALPPAVLTAVCRHDKESPYWFAGDAAGRVLVMDTRHGARCVRTLETVASAREASRVMTSKTVVDFPNLIHALAARGDAVVLWTAHELQALRISTGETIFLIETQTTAEAIPQAQATAAAASMQCLDWSAVIATSNLPLGPTDAPNYLLWQTGSSIQPVLAEDSLSDNGDNDSAAENKTPWLYCVDCSNPRSLQWKILRPGTWNKSHEPMSEPSFTLTDNTSHAVAWDVHNPNAFLQVVANSTADVWELHRVDASTCQIVDRTALTHAGNAPGSNNAMVYTGCRMVQAAEYLFLCTNRGIRCFDAARLGFLSVYGETVALHGKTVGWQDCMWLPQESAWPLTTWQAVDTKKTNASNNTGIGGLGTSGQLSSFGSAGNAQMSSMLSTQDELARRKATLAIHNGNHKSSRRSLNRLSSGTSDASETGNQVQSSPNGYQHTDSSAKNLFSNMLLVGIPHPHRGPTELQSTLYVWKPGQVLPHTTLQAPPGGLLGVRATASPVSGWHLMCATAAHGQAWEWKPTLQSDFPGNMYPTHYQVIDDNVEYIEDEDELDKNVTIRDSEAVSTSSSTTREEQDLQRALRESLEEENDKINVLHDDNIDEQQEGRLRDTNIDENKWPNPFASCVLAWPDPSLRHTVFSQMNNRKKAQKSPSRFSTSRPEPELFVGFPQLAFVRKARHTRRESLSSTPPPLLTDADRSAAAKPIKSKRTKLANVEVMLQNAINPMLCEEMTLVQRKWSDGKGSRSSCSLTLTSLKDVSTVKRTAEEKELALELLLLSPNSRSETPTKADDRVCNPVNVPSSNTAAGVSGANFAVGLDSTSGAAKVEPPRIVSGSTASSGDSEAKKGLENKNPSGFCAACHGRMVIHACGKREKPVDMEAIQRAEAERKAAEEAEKQRIKVEKRRQAEAKRREARKKKKEEEERQRREMELQKLEEERVAAMHQMPSSVLGYTATATATYASVETSSSSMHRKIPRYAELMSAPVSQRDTEYSFGYAATSNGSAISNHAKDGYARQPSSTVSDESVYSSTSFTPAAVEPLFRPEETMPLDETPESMYAPTESTFHSMSVTTASVSKPLAASDDDALAALAALADQSSKVVPPSGWRTSAEARHYDYSGADERRRAILNSLHFGTTSGGATEEQSYSSVYDRPSYLYTTTEGESAPASSSVGKGLVYFNHQQSKQEE